ncbi:hypothetical protein PanWU01x14_296760 [Parasponia andersonii]|uniref:Uncharacterized protein n=1 Tax=Parasponia andersonii TaxID=3476 RepID=A0A2P5AVE9_PARAD|nr:hypothetical protein PanWU01x14_296760 [Parasponia andersonii]
MLDQISSSNEPQPSMKLEADSIRFLLRHRRSLKLDSSDSFSAIDELRVVWCIYWSNLAFDQDKVYKKESTLKNVYWDHNSFASASAITP